MILKVLNTAINENKLKKILTGKEEVKLSLLKMT
jgi:hypothetical protein